MFDESGGEAGGELPWQLKPGVQVAGFTVEGLLASGSFGTVYRARRDGRLFAIKLVPMEPRGDREVDALRRVRHPNVVGFHGYGLWPDDEPRFLVLALELVEGRTLDVWMLEENPSALELVEQVLLPLAGTLSAVHAEGVVHRDIKEANIVMREADGQPVLVDFGSAGYEGAPRLTAVLPPGTPEYRSPEAVRFARESSLSGPYPAGPGDDLWALGVTTYVLLTRALPFGDRQSPGMNRAILHESPPAPHEHNPRVPPALSELCLRMLEKAPEARYADAEALKEELEAATAGADDLWHVPLFPGGRRERSPPPAQSLAAHARSWLRWGPLAAVLVLGAALVLASTPNDTTPNDTTPRTALSHHHATPWAGFGQEFAAADMTGEVVSSAEPHRSSTPALIARAMHNEKPMMKMSSTVRGFIVATLTGSACVGSGCATSPLQRPPPPQEECPPGAWEAMERLSIQYGDTFIYDPTQPSAGRVIVKEGDFSAVIMQDWGGLPAGTSVYGELIFGKGRVYGRLKQAMLPGGEVVPICAEMLEGTNLPGTAMEPESTAENVVVRAPFLIGPVPHFGYF
jgi:eukaryotic-like serine/threonine-protein kinase